MRTFTLHESPEETGDNSDYSRRELAMVAMIQNLNSHVETLKSAYKIAAGKELHGAQKEMSAAQLIFEADELLSAIPFYHGVNGL